MILEIMGHAPIEAVEIFCQQIRDLGLTATDESANGVVILRVHSVNDINRGSVRKYFRELEEKLERSQYLHSIEISEKPIRTEPGLMTV